MNKVLEQAPLIEDHNVYLEELKNFGYIKVAEKISLLWGNPECNDYFMEVIIDSRGNRQGFPHAVFDLLLKLYLYHENKFKK